MSKNQMKLAVVLLLAAFCAGRFSSPKSVEIKEVEKIVYKENEKSNEQKDTHFKVIEKTLPDGTKIKKTVRDSTQKSEKETQKDIASETERSSKTSSQSSQWSLGLYTSGRFYAGTIDRRILGGLFLGAYGRMNIPYSNFEYSLGVRLEF
jgi:hypothetical protein